MANFIYEWYNTKQEYTMELSALTVLSGDWYSGYPGYTFDKNTGKFATTGSYQQLNAPYGDKKPLYNVYLSGTELHISSGTLYGDTYSKQIATSSSVYVKRDYLGTVVGGENQYPLDGRSGTYWYVRTNTLSETTTPTQPSGGQTIDSNFNVTWTRTASDTNTDIELSFDNGATWERIASGVVDTSLSYNFINELIGGHYLIRLVL